MSDASNEMGFIQIKHVDGVKSVSDDDLCSNCKSCQYRPGEMSGCDLGWPGRQDEDGYVNDCGSFCSVG
jgi:hypothetical protein